ncbi:malate dehydrogenase [Methanospirillum stamsii]|uniref:malate dehydrogenase n=1 Tax=Methanospirillum stamsii TaxID=1277351 RepID=A0A2V2N6E2_9EURY|nr:lactate dehydrogenase [Methanospirillum stamsii]PWR73296.1 lactate dehydrogenase [Methanospirillum stamsii]
MTSLAVFGTGRIGGGVASRAVSSGLIDNLVLYDCYQPLLEAQRLDLEHMRCPVTISTNPEKIAACDIILYTAGLPRNPNIKTRAALLDCNVPVAAELAALIPEYKGILIVVTNPADVLTYYLWKKIGLSKNRIIGFGGQLDGARFNYELRLRDLRPDGIILGEHGEHQVPIFSLAGLDVDLSSREEILTTLRNASMEIIKGKGATEYAPVYHIWQLVSAILTDSKENFVCSAIMDGEYGISGCSLGIPVIIGREGILSVKTPELDSWEMEHYLNAAGFVTDLCRRLNFD